MNKKREDKLKNRGIKMIVSDFDGTLVNSEDGIPSSTIVLIDQLRRAGYKFVITTGRCFNSISYYNKDYPFIDYIVSCNGAYIYDSMKQKTIYKKHLLINNVKKIIKKYIDSHIIYVIDDNIWHLLSKDSAYEEEFDTVKEDDYNKFLESNKDNLYKMEIYFETLQEAEIVIQELKSMTLKIKTNIQMNKDKYKVEITHQDVNKLEGIKKIGKLEKISLEEVLSFGDGYSDIELLKESFLSIAPNTAVEEVKLVADFITLDCNHKGVETYLRNNIDFLLSRQ